MHLTSTNLLSLMKTSPDDAESCPASILNVVVFPAPFTPSSPKHCLVMYKKRTLIFFVMMEERSNFIREDYA